MKKLLCGMLVLAMLLTMMPAVYATETTTVEDHVFHEFTSAEDVHKWGASWNDTYLYYTAEDAVNYPDSYRDKTVNFTIDGTETTLYAKYVVTADTKITRSGYDYSLKWDKIGKKATDGAYRDSDETNNRIESHGKQGLYDDRLSVKLLRGNIGNKDTEFNPETMMQNNTPAVDISKYGYVNMWMYSSAVASSSLCVDLYFSRTLNATLEDKLNYRGYITPDWIGWKLVSIPVKSFGARNSDATYPTYVNNVGFAMTQTEADKLPEGYYINVNKIWASLEKPAEAVVSENEETLMFYKMDSASNAHKWGNNYNHVSGVFKDDDYCSDITGHEKSGDYTFLFKADSVNTYAGNNCALVWDRINETDSYYNDPAATDSHKRSVARNQLNSPRVVDAPAVDLNNYDYINIRANVQNSTPDMTITSTSCNYYTKIAEDGTKSKVEENSGVTATAKLGANGWQIIKLPITVTGNGLANRLFLKVAGATSNLVITIDSIWYSKAEDLTNGAKTYFDFTTGTNQGFASQPTNSSGDFVSTADVDKTTFSFPTYKWYMPYSSSSSNTGRIYCKKDMDLSDYADGYLNMWVYSSAATNNKYVTVLSAENTPRNNGTSGNADYRTANGNAHLVVDWAGWKLVSFKLSTKSSESNLPLTLTPTYYGTMSGTTETNIPKAGYYSDITKVQFQLGGYDTYYKKDSNGNLYADEQTLWIADVFATKEKPTQNLVEWTIPETIGVNDEIIFRQNAFPEKSIAYEISDGTNVISETAYSVENINGIVKINFVEPLAYGKTYTIKALNGTTVIGQNKFTTEAAGELTYSAPVLKTKFATGNIKVGATVNNKTTSTAPACLIIAVYDNETGELLNVAVNEKVITAYTETAEIAEIIAVENSDTSYIKAFVWNGIDEMKPITDILQYPEAQ
ncbi:MAG: hypothetical protein IJC74_06710 [Clostridia bacterium]|nr:hypothetical protein [Clostridia bacterium]